MMTEFEFALEQIRELHGSKSHDYGKDGEPFHNVIEGARFAGIEPWVAAMIRANDKMGRLSRTARGFGQRHASATDDLLDIATYALIAYCLINRPESRQAWPQTDPLTRFMGWGTEGWPEPVSDD